MKNYKNKTTSSLVLLVLIFNTSLHSQTSKETSLNEFFDQAVGKENLAIYNGPRHVNYYRTMDDSHSYYLSPKFSSGDLTYENQTYYNLDLKYDVNNDILVLKPIGEYDYLGINVIKEKTASFSINNKRFININYNNPTCPDYMNGYYQEIAFSKNNILYIKHHKIKSKVINNQMISEGISDNTSNVFKDNNEFVLKYKNNYYNISSKSDIIKIFPDYKSKIKNYYSNNGKLEKFDNKIFIENLIKEINNLLPNEFN